LLTFKRAAGVVNIQVIYILDLRALFCAIYLDDANLVGDSEPFLEVLTRLGLKVKEDSWQQCSNSGENSVINFLDERTNAV
jgi:hypothetical protein